MNSEACDWCCLRFDSDALYPITHISSGYVYHWCASCVRQNVGRNHEAYSYRGPTFRERYEAIRDSYLTEVAEAQLAQDTQTAQQIHDRAADGLELDALFGMPSDAVLDAYIDANPDKFTYVVSLTPSSAQLRALKSSTASA
jgi:hypothetical protein